MTVDAPPGGRDGRVPGYLGRVLYATDDPAGTCFQVAPGVLVTAAHVCDEVGAGYPGAAVRVDALAGGAPAFEASVARLDAVHDLAVLTSTTALAGSVAGWVATDRVALGTATVITGAVDVPDPRHSYRYLDADGHWAGGTTRDEQVPLGRLQASSVMKGMSGGPVRRASDDFVVGVVSERYNAADGWMRDSVLVARIEDLQPLLDGLAGIELTGLPPLTAAVDITLTVTDAEVRLRGAGIDITGAHSGIRPGLAGALHDVLRERARRSRTAVVRTGTGEQARESVLETVSLRRAGRLASESFLPPPVSEALGELLARVTAVHVPLRIGVEPRGFAVVPWEALPDPVTSKPLALHPLITVYRRLPAVPVRPIPGPLRILVAIAAPDEGDGMVLDYERELRNVLSAVKGARHGDAEVRIVEFATTTAIRAELEQFPAHVLHLSGHGTPGHLHLETGTGAARPMTAAELLSEAIPAGAMPPVIGLAACYTDVADEAGAPSFAAALLAEGASVVIATETSVTDRYATALFARVYQHLANHPVPDVVAAVAEARRVVHHQWSTSPDPRDNHLAALDEWSVVTVLAAHPGVEVYPPATGNESATPRTRAAAVAGDGLVQRETGDFVGRRRELRTLPDVLEGNQYSGIVIHGLGGIGKTTLATQLLHRQQWARLVVVFTGELTIDSLLSTLAHRIGRYYLMDSDNSPDRTITQALQYLTHVDQPWEDRQQVLREYVLDQLPILVVLDNFEDNLTGTYTVTDDALARLLAKWIIDPGRSRLLVTCRYRFALPERAHTLLLAHPLGPMSRAETFKLIWALPALDRLDDSELDRVWRLVGGHPRSLEYLDALLDHRVGRYRDITARLENALAAYPGTRPVLTAGADLDAALATTITVIADDILLTELLDRLTPDARRLLIGASVYREPVDYNALLFQIGADDPGAAWTPDREKAEQSIVSILTGHGIDPTAEEFGLDRLPPEILTAITPALTEFNAAPRPPVSTDLDTTGLVQELWSHSLISIDAQREQVFVHRATATALHESLHRQRREAEVTAAHSRAARYWWWREQVWPQDRDADLHDLLEARQHLQQAGQVSAAIAVTAIITTRLRTIGARDREAALIHHTLTQLPADSPDRSPWLEQLGNLAHLRGDYGAAERLYRQALAINEEVGDRLGIAGISHQLGMLAAGRRDFTEAERLYRQSLAIKQELGDSETIAVTLHQLGILAGDRGDFEEAERLYRQSLTVSEELGDAATIAITLHQLGILAGNLGDFDEAERLYRRSLAIKEELGNLSGIAASLHQLGMLAAGRGELGAAERLYRRSLEIREELGDLSGIAASLHQLGMLAEGRGDYGEGERLYRQTLAMSKELGDDATVAIAATSLGFLESARNQFAEAVHWQLVALLLRVELERAGMAMVDLGRNVRALLELRRRMGRAEFLAKVTDLLSSEEARRLEEQLDSVSGE
ncbi:tetratricopeptide repeat protein [Nocardia lijiangensis]|uniref:tetratricopeptide repeat protein n=1 Tax=Nocardia lijiangensis TaxID=299618 RepID=UPI0012DE4C1C|nr:tetratricopeptide repeat protein [Nocardia lijiangensis]